MKGKSTLGLEVEFMLIDKEGKISNKADAIISRAKSANPDAFVIPEIAENMLELGSTPSTRVSESARSLLENMGLAVKAASKEQALLLPMATYPGYFKPRMREKGVYLIKKKIFQERFDMTGECVGYHLHHALPEGSFDATSKNLKAKLSSKAKKSLVESYNLSIAIDPVLTTLMQSSPFYRGEHLGMDSRMVVYRGGSALGYTKGLYSHELEAFGELPKYEGSDETLLDNLIHKYSQWKRLIRDIAPDLTESANYGSILATNWSPVKINPHGTIEMRGMDMNFPSLTFAISACVKYLFQHVYDRALHVVPSEQGIAEYFKEENGKLYVPPDFYVRKRLQYLSAYQGIKNEKVHHYCEALLKLVRSLMPAASRSILNDLMTMIEEKETISDKIFRSAKKLGYEGGKLSDEIAQKISLAHATKLLDDMPKTRDLLDKHKYV